MHRNNSDGFEHLNARLYQNYGRQANTTPRETRRTVSAGAGASARLTQQYQQLASGSSSRLQKARPQPKAAPPQPWRREATRDRRPPVASPRVNTPPLSRNETPRSMTSMGGGNVRDMLNNIVALASQIAESAEHEPHRGGGVGESVLKSEEIERVVQKVQQHFTEKINKLTQERNELQASRDELARRLQDEQRQRLLVEEQGQLLASEQERVVQHLEERSRRLQLQNRQLQELLHRKNSEGASKEVLEPVDEELRSDSPAVDDSHSWLQKPAFDAADPSPMVEVEMSVQRGSEPLDSVGQLHRMTPISKPKPRPQLFQEEDDVTAFLDSISKDIADLESA